MDIVIQIGLICALLYALGVLLHGRRSRRRLVFLRTLAFLTLTALGNALLLVLLAVGGGALLSAVALIKDPNAFDSARNAAGILQSRFGDFRSVWLLLTLLVLVLLTAVIQLAVRRALTLRFHLAADEEVYEIAEYFIQWFTIFLVVYQLYFAEIKEVFEAYLSRSLTNMAFDIALTPENLNIVMQPIAFSTWVVIAVEHMRKHAAHSAPPDAPPDPESGVGGG